MIFVRAMWISPTNGDPVTIVLSVTVTSRPMGDYEIDGESCWFVDHERMLDGLENNEFLDVGEHDNYLFGTTLESVRGVMSENKLCVLDVRPEVRTDTSKIFSDNDSNNESFEMSLSGLKVIAQFHRVLTVCDILEPSST